MGFSVGKCSFEGTKPHQCTTQGKMSVYHNGSVKKTGTSGKKNIWSGTGDVFIIFKGSDEVSKHEFKVDGKIQICNDF